MSIGSPLQSVQGSVPSSSIPGGGGGGGRRPQTPVLCEPGHGHLTHLRISVPGSGAPPGQVPADCHPGGAPTRKSPSLRRVSFAEEATVWEDVSTSVCSPEQVTSVQLVPAVAEEDVIAPVEGPIGSSSTAPASLPPPLRFSPFAWPVDDGNMDIDLSCFPFDVNCSPDVLIDHLSSTSSSSPATQGCSDISDSIGSPEVKSLMSP